jgi:MoaA/NifB/PqqE/SkfB family radical SAM enzyme
MKKNNENKINDKVESLCIFKCNCRCVMCSVGLQLDRSANNSDYHAIRPLEEVKKDIDKAKKNNASAFAFSGGEPAMRKDLAELVEYAKNIGIEHIEVQSNGRVYANKDYARRLIDAGVNSFVISFHSPIEEVNDTIMGVLGAYKQQVQGIKNLNSFGQKVKINIVITRYNYQDLAKHVKFLIDNFQVSEFRFTFVLVEGYAKESPQKIVPKMSEVGKYICQAIEFSKDKVACFIYNITPCLVSGCENYINDMGKFNTLLLGPEFERSLDEAKENDKLKSKKCSACIHNNWCNGVWKNYAAIYGIDELKPVN